MQDHTNAHQVQANNQGGFKKHFHNLHRHFYASFCTAIALATCATALSPNVAMGSEFNCKADQQQATATPAQASGNKAGAKKGAKGQNKADEGEPVDIIRIFPIKDWSRYRCNSCKAHPVTGRLSCYCHKDSNKPDFDIARLTKREEAKFFVNTACRFCININEKAGSSVMCYCHDFTYTPPKPAPAKPQHRHKVVQKKRVPQRKPAPKPVHKPAPKPVQQPVRKPAEQKPAPKPAPVEEKPKANQNNIKIEYIQRHSTTEDVTIINNYHSGHRRSAAASSRESSDDDLPEDRMPGYRYSRCRPGDRGCNGVRSSSDKYHQQDMNLVDGE